MQPKLFPSAKDYTPSLAHKYCKPNKGDTELQKHDLKNFKQRVTSGYFIVRACVKCHHKTTLDFKKGI